MPGTLVSMALKSPRMLVGASGLGSQMSMWLGPPCRNSRMTEFARPKPAPPPIASTAAVAACASRSASAWLSEMPKMPSEPTRRNSRRVGPSQVWPDFPGITSMSELLELTS